MARLKPLMPLPTYLKKARRLANEPAGTIVKRAMPAGKLARDLYAMGLRLGDGIPATKINPDAYNYIKRKDLVFLRNTNFLSRRELADILDIDIVRITRWLKPGKNLDDFLPIKIIDFDHKVSAWRAVHGRGLGRNALEIARGNYRPK